RQRPVPEEVALHAQLRDVADLSELAIPGDGVRQGRTAQPLEAVEVEGWLRGLDESGDARVESAQMKCARRVTAVARSPGSESDQVVRSAGLRSGADRRALPPAERLALHDG